ncbi:S-adenosyl-L-methionine-dependent methyltransferase [Xylariaceae sp. FL1272]|nr:S-adenosyl-L-methionine-dependent methyltransferase [Xylariaceae sp. FL1272]
MAAPSSHVEAYDQSKYWIAPCKNFRSSARLHLQHLLIQNTLGYLLEPVMEKSIVTNSPEPLRIADLACGNGIWLLDLHSYLAQHNIAAQLDGFDINPIMFPHPTYLPTAVSLKPLDILAKPTPPELVGIYDIVHIRAFGSVIPDGDLTPVLSVASALLKPGGYLQWEETRGDRFIVESPSPDVSKVACDTITNVLKAGLQAKGISNAWVDVLDTHLTKFGLHDALQHVQEKRKQDFKGWTENYLMVWEDLAQLFPPKAQKPDAPMSLEAWSDLFAKGVKETEQGVIVHQGTVVTAIGKKDH